MHSKTGNLDLNVMASEFEDNAGSPHSTSNMGNFKCGSLNVCGIKRRLHYPEFVSLFKEHDIFVYVKRKLKSMMSLHWKAINFHHNVENRSISAKVVALGCLSKMTCILT